jgi:hypothetical protein
MGLLSPIERIIGETADEVYHSCCYFLDKNASLEDTEL